MEQFWISFHHSSCGRTIWVAGVFILFYICCFTHPPHPMHTPKLCKGLVSVLHSVKEAERSSWLLVTCQGGPWPVYRVPSVRGSAEAEHLWLDSEALQPPPGAGTEIRVRLADLKTCQNSSLQKFPFLFSLSSPRLPEHLEEAVSGFRLLRMTRRVIEFRLLCILPWQK